MCDTYIIKEYEEDEESSFDDLEKAQELNEVVTDLGDAIVHLLGGDTPDDPPVIQIEITQPYDPSDDEDEESESDDGDN